MFRQKELWKLVAKLYGKVFEESNNTVKKYNWKPEGNATAGDGWTMKMGATRNGERESISEGTNWNAN